MKIALLHGALINSGDFLIAQRSKELLKYVYPDAIIHVCNELPFWFGKVSGNFIGKS